MGTSRKFQFFLIVIILLHSLRQICPWNASNRVLTVSTQLLFFIERSENCNKCLRVKLSVLDAAQHFVSS